MKNWGEAGVKTSRMLSHESAGLSCSRRGALHHPVRLEVALLM